MRTISSLALGLLLSAAISLDSGCLRFGYGERRDAGAGRFDAGYANPDAGLQTRTDAGTAGRGGAGGQSGAAAVAGTGGAGGAGSPPTDAGQPPTDAGLPPTDAGLSPTDAGLPPSDAGPAIRCPSQPDVLFCDDFEADFVGHWAYALPTPPAPGSPERVTTRAHSGAWSLHATTAKGRLQSRLVTEALVNQKSGDAWMRFFSYVPSSVQVVGAGYFSIGFLSEATSPYDGFELRVMPSGVDISYQIGSQTNVIQGVSAYARDQWICVEMHVLIDASAGKLEAYFDGTLAVAQQGLDTLPRGGYGAAEVGIHLAAPTQGAAEVFVDDMVLSRSRVGCN